MRACVCLSGMKTHDGDHTGSVSLLEWANQNEKRNIPDYIFYADGKKKEDDIRDIIGMYCTVYQLVWFIFHHAVNIQLFSPLWKFAFGLKQAYLSILEPRNKELQ